METYMERKLTNLHYAGSRANVRDKVASFVVGLTLIVMLPYLHIGVFYKYIWVPGKRNLIDKFSCSCGCFDTIFRGEYEHPISSYKHVYFNATTNTFEIWLVTVATILLTYESIKYLFGVYRRKSFRYDMLVVFLSSVYPHYYSWWSYFNYINEEFYQHWYHHFMFAITELLSTAMVLHLCDKTHKIETYKLLFIISINTFHIVVSGLDQFIEHVVYMKGLSFQSLRDVGLMIPDIIHVTVPVYQCVLMAKRKNVSLFNLFYKEEIMAAVLFITLCTIFGRII